MTTDYLEIPLLEKIRNNHPDIVVPEFLEGISRQIAQPPSSLGEFDDVREKLLKVKQIYQSAYIQADQKNIGTSEIGKFWSDFADWCLQTGCQWAWQTPRIKKTWKVTPVDDPVPGLIVLGLGKLGGHDLNFSSDVDLITFYNPETVATLPYEGKTDVTANVMRGLIKIIDGEKSTGQFVWRTDFRLRPDPSVTDLSMSNEAALHYFFFNSSPWRRLAMMKARPVAGDIEAGKAFMAELEPFIWRRHLDYTAIDEIASIKQRIHAEHPGLSSERVQEQPLEQAAGFNVKLGRGGIREIEFMVNAYQLLWGGRDKTLRTTHTLTALDALDQQGYVNREDRVILETSYLFFRALENRIQYFEDRHTHKVPEVANQQEWLAYQSGCTNWTELADRIIELRKQVAELFDGMFNDSEMRASQPGPQTSSNQENETLVVPAQLLEKLEKRPTIIAEEWLKGFRRYGGYQEVHQELGPLGERLLTIVARLPDPNKAVMKLHGLFNSLGIATSYLRLLSQSDRLVENTIIPFLYAEAMSILLEQSPHVIDGLLSNGGQIGKTPDDEMGKTMVFASRAYENQLEALRAWTNEQLYLTYLNVLNDKRPPQASEIYLSDLASLVVRLAANAVARDADLQDGLPFSVLALGKLGMNKMTPMSDLDLVFISDEGLDIDFANKLSRKLQTALNAKMREGRAYEIDMRLRPSGASGPPTVSLSSFRYHHLQGRARTWEHLALVPARIIYGKQESISQITATLKEIRTRPRDVQQLINDSFKMLSRLREHRISAHEENFLEIKLRPGGLMEAEYLMTFLILKYGADLPELLEVELDDAARILGKLFTQYEPIAPALRFWRDSLFFRRLVGEETLEGILSDNQLVYKKLKERLWLQHFGQDFESKSRKHAKHILALIATEIEAPASIPVGELEDYREQSIIWQ